LYKQQQELEKPRQFRIGVYKSGRQQQLLYVINAIGEKLDGMEHDEGITITEDYLALFDPTYKFVSMRGGRGGGKTDTVAMVLILIAYTKKLRVLCFREVQNSIRQSVYASLKKQIERLKLESFFANSTDNEIRGANGSLFIFKGLRDQTVENIKSFSDIDLCWGEEARVLTERSLQVLIPTIRNEGARFFFTWNPQLDTDAVYQRYALNTRENVKDIEVNYKHNPWFPNTMDEERVEDLKRLPSDQYDWIWEGKILPARVGSVYFNEYKHALDQNRVTRVAVDPMLAVHQFWDLGVSDDTAIILVQIHLSEVRCVGYIANRGKPLSFYNDEVRAWGREHGVTMWGTVYLPHDAAARSLHTGVNTDQMMKSFGWENTKIGPRLAVDIGIRAARMMWPTVWIDRDNCGQLIECLKNYSYKENADGSLGEPLHDNFSHGADAFRYIALEREKLTETLKKKYTGQPMRRNHTVYR
jgi:phage terminase large subunit